MKTNEMTPDEMEIMADQILSSRKYRNLDIPKKTIIDLISQEEKVEKNQKIIEKKAKEKIHQIMAPYLGDPDYETAEKTLIEAASQGQESIKSWCLQMLSSHSSSKERIPFMSEFYQQIFSVTGKPNSILDLACAMNPFSFPWMGLTTDCSYHAYDLHTPRVHLINHFFSALGMKSFAETKDILLEPPNVQADLAFFFKEAHRFENRRKGCLKSFWSQLPVKKIIVTLPATNLTAQHQMRERQTGLISASIAGLNYTLESFEINGEMVFIIKKET